MRVHTLGAIVLFALALSPVAGCRPGDQPPATESSGFLSDYSQLQPGRADQAHLIYIDPQADFSSYQNVIIDPVAIWQGEGSSFSGVSPDELESLARDLRASMRRELAHEFQVLDRPAAGTLRIRIALVEVKRGGASSGADFVGSVAIELEILDAVSGERLIAVVDSRGESGEPRDSHRAGTSVRTAFDGWASRARDRLSMFRDFDAAQAGLEVRPESGP